MNSTKIDRQDFGAFYEDTYDAVVARIARRMNDSCPDDPEDLAHEVYLKLWRTWKGEVNYAWLWTSVDRMLQNHHRDMQRVAERQMPEMYPDEGEDLTLLSDLVEEKEWSADRKLEWKGAMEALKEDGLYTEASLRLQGYKIREIVDRVPVSRWSVKKRLRLAQSLLNDHLSLTASPSESRPQRVTPM